MGERAEDQAVDKAGAAVDPSGPPCPECGRPGVPVLYGLPGPEAGEAAAEGKLRLAGCLLPQTFDHWACTGGGHRWRDTPAGAARPRRRCRHCYQSWSD
ncbi:hypothetical protein [Plantactinospora sp. B5E13]|uniref:hypothetical protein n=1 Tax=Plantactinospora sp. B5E13 TaxID=3153758 RepID=UPI00325CFD91